MADSEGFKLQKAPDSCFSKRTCKLHLLKSDGPIRHFCCQGTNDTAASMFSQVVRDHKRKNARTRATAGRLSLNSSIFPRNTVFPFVWTHRQSEARGDCCRRCRNQRLPHWAERESPGGIRTTGADRKGCQASSTGLQPVCETDVKVVGLVS